MTAGPDPEVLTNRLATSDYPHLAAAARRGERWLVTLAAQLVGPDNDVDPSAEQLLADVAGFRRRWSVAGPEPLGEASIDVDQANERAVLAIAIDHHRIDLPATLLDDEPSRSDMTFDVAAALDW